MIGMLITIAILLILAGFSNSIMDTVDFRFSQSIFSKLKSEKARLWWNQSQGWKNKYKDRDPDKGPAFPGSTTIFVWVTDAWHFFQMIMYTSLQLAIIIPVHKIICENCYVNPFIFYVALLIICKFITGGTFELFWSVIWKKK